ncbi:DUF982 domain-containing protein [Starkeya sp. ORNL1]|uniref:DUF982 domain-containing protein n=1 Tax=Starkeya sp. ORNL1 TaxID=2709380 RepID=UPI001FEEC00A|nr:DUF982 domain-containing protein [Starkeya sp. ORNL1]
MQRQIADVGEAALVLLYKWPEADVTSRPHLTARKPALAALEGKGTHEAFRAAFIKAADRVEILAPGPDRPSVTLPGHVARPWARRLKR